MDVISPSTQSQEPHNALIDYQPIFSYHLTQGQKHRIYSLATDTTGQKIALGSERSLYILSLSKDGGDKEEQISIKKALYPSKDSPGSVLTWCHDKLKSNLISSSNGNNLLIYDTNDEKYIYTMNQAHVRNITSLSWNRMDSNILASASSDSFIKVWDTRDQKGGSGISINTQSSLNQIEWNPHSATMIASSHCGQIKIWDIRKFGSPLTSFTAHIGNIPSIEWHHKDKSTILTCGTDKSIKIWEASPPSKLLRSFKTGSPCSLSRFVPFTNQQAVATIHQKGDHEISFWAGNSGDSSVMNLVGHQSPIISFDWRVVDTGTGDINDRKYYLVSLGKDNYIKMWKFTDEMISNININVTSPETKSISKRISIPLDLNQELLRIGQEKFKNLTIERTNISDRICVVNLDNRKIIIIITFPSLYPSAPPAFEILLKSSPSTNNIKVQLKRELDRLSLEFIQSKKPFLYPLLQKFSEFYSQEIEKEPLCYQNIKDFVDSPQINKRTSLTMQPFSKLVEFQRQLFQSDSNTTNINTQTQQPQQSSSSTLSPTSPSMTLSPIKENSNDTQNAEQADSDQSNRHRSYSSTPVFQSQQQQQQQSTLPPLDNVGGRHRAGSVGSSFAPLPPNAPYYNSNQTVLFEMYEVKPTDTLTGIALHFNMPRNVLVQTNRLLSEKIIPGQILWVFKRKDKTVDTQQEKSTDKPIEFSTLSINDSVSAEDSPNLTSPLSFSMPTIVVSPQQQPQQLSPISQSQQILPPQPFGNRPRSRSSNSYSVNINDLFKPMKEEVQMAFKTLDPNGGGHQRSNSGGGLTKSLSHNSFDSWTSDLNRFNQLSKDDIHKEEVVCTTKSMRMFGTLTLTPYQFIFQSQYSADQIFGDYIQIITCKYFPNKTEWSAHLSRDWKKEQRLIKKKNQDDEDYDPFIQNEVAKLNELEDERTITVNGKEKKVLVYPCIFVLLYKDKHIETLFFRGTNESSIQQSYQYLEKLIVDRTTIELSSLSSSPILGSSPTNTTSSVTPMSSPQIGIAESFDLTHHHNYTPKLIQNYTKYDKPLEPALLTSEIYKKLLDYLPLRLQSNDIELRYNSSNDGVSFQTFFRKMKDVKFSLLLIKDNGGHIFGAFLSDEIKISETSYAHSYGDGETFLFKIHPEFHVWKWTKANDFFICSTIHYFAVGGGGGSFGLWMDTDFLHGSSNVCETFNNQCLSHKSDFDPIVVEAWSVETV